MAVIQALVGFFAMGLVQWALIRLVAYFYNDVLDVDSGLLKFLYVNIILAIVTGPAFWMWDLMKPVAGWWFVWAAVWIAGCVVGHRAAGLVLR